MIAFDTNLLVRALVVDNPDQVEVVRQLIASDTVFISRTVLLESEWVLRSRYKKTRRQLIAFFTALLGIDNTVVENAEAISHALEMQPGEMLALEWRRIDLNRVLIYL